LGDAAVHDRPRKLLVLLPFTPADLRGIETYFRARIKPVLKLERVTPGIEASSPSVDLEDHSSHPLVSPRQETLDHRKSRVVVVNLIPSMIERLLHEHHFPLECLPSILGRPLEGGMGFRHKTRHRHVEREFSVVSPTGGRIDFTDQTGDGCNILFRFKGKPDHKVKLDRHDAQIARGQDGLHYLIGRNDLVDDRSHFLGRHFRREGQVYIATSCEASEAVRVKTVGSKGG
jgi:hypothetical protein